MTNDYYYLNNEWYEIKTGQKVNFEELDEDMVNRLKEYENNCILELDISKSIFINELLK